MNIPTILLVEDDPNDEALTRLALDENRVKNDLVVAHDGVEALDYLFGRGKFSGRDVSLLPSVVLLDLKLPKVSGLEVLRKIREDARTHLLPIVIFTSSREEKDIIEGYRLGANAYVRKPVEFSEFSAAVRELGLFWIVLNLPASKVRKAA